MDNSVANKTRSKVVKRILHREKTKLDGEMRSNGSAMQADLQI